MYFLVTRGLRRRSKPLVPSIAAAGESQLFSQVALIAQLRGGDASSFAGPEDVG